MRGNENALTVKTDVRAPNYQPNGMVKTGLARNISLLSQQTADRQSYSFVGAGREESAESAQWTVPNALHDRAFDQCLMWIDSDFKVRFSPVLQRNSNESAESLDWLLSFEDKPLLFRKSFSPTQSFLQYTLRVHVS
jgi:hypothetical protein